ncbi:hypothetical protein [Reyranella sp.]|uniref:hypothetical protein n=1 Tax=Reyranella sp. TaxID=1929291 RepID=UPI002716C728|nr:hypothetical protein [Reyranella sp.]MDO8973885.1 hypothetical protein [Reyranella sp.]
MKPKPDRHSKAIERTEVTHGIYHIIAGHQADTGRAIAYLGGRPIHVATATSVETAVAATTAALDLRKQNLRNQRQDDVPSVAEFQEALNALDPRTFATIAPLLRIHRHLPRQAASIADVARVSGLEESAALALYLKLGKAMASTLDIVPEGNGLARRILPLLVFATVEPGDGRKILLQLRPTFVDALDECAGPFRRTAA